MGRTTESSVEESKQIPALRFRGGERNSHHSKESIRGWCVTAGGAMVPVTRWGRGGKAGGAQQWEEKAEGLQGVQGKWKEAEGESGREGG